MSKRAPGRVTSLSTALIVWVASAASAVAQDQEAVRALKKLHDELCQPQRVISKAEGDAALAKLREFNLTPEALPEKDRPMLLATQVFAALAAGDARSAGEKLNALQAAAPEARETLDAAYLVAAATGDVAAGEAALKQLSKSAPEAERPALAQRQRWLRRSGAEVPSVEVVTDDRSKIRTRERHGVVLVIDFWNTHDTTKEYAKALKDLRESLKAEIKLQVVGVNSNGKAEDEAARRFAKDAGYTWPQCYEEKAARGPITYDAFKAGAPPWTVVIDGAGHVRAVGAVTEPAFQYGLRSALADTKGEFAAGAEAKTGKEQASVQGAGDLPSNDEAEAMLREARTYIRTGMKTKARELLKEIIAKYPGTKQAKEAKERLDLLGGG